MPVPARDPLESRLVGLWEDLFGFAPIGVTDRFFELGGHSLEAVRMISRLERETGVHVPLSSLVEADTIEKLCAPRGPLVLRLVHVARCGQDASVLGRPGGGCRDMEDRHLSSGVMA